MAMALYSAISGRPASNDVAMTGEITLRGNVLPIGGLNEKLIAAKRYGIKTVLIPRENEIDIKELNPKVTEGLNIIPIDKIEEAIPYIFTENKKPANIKNKKAPVKKGKRK